MEIEMGEEGKLLVKLKKEAPTMTTVTILAKSPRGEIRDKVTIPLTKQGLALARKTFKSWARDNLRVEINDHRQNVRKFFRSYYSNYFAIAVMEALIQKP